MQTTKKTRRIEIRKRHKWQSVPNEIKSSLCYHTDRGKYYTAVVTPEEEKHWKHKSRKYKMRFISYDARFVRSSYYRKKFLKNKGTENHKYRCVYCGKKLSEDDMVVDHIVSIKGAQASAYARFLLRSMDGINDIRNLVPSCERCNGRKGDRYSLKWRIKAHLGSREWYWMLRRAVLLYVYAAILLLLWKQEEVNHIVTVYVEPFMNRYGITARILTLFNTYLIPLFAEAAGRLGIH